MKCRNIYSSLYALSSENQEKTTISVAERSGCKIANKARALPQRGSGGNPFSFVL